MNPQTLDIKIYGIVQGVGFRPFVARLAAACGVTGSVCNKGPYVQIFAQGTDTALADFRLKLEMEAPERSAILKVDVRPVTSAEAAYEGFAIVESARERGDIFVSPDIATCDSCAAELRDPHNRHYLHPFINCTACGPRLTILESMPYDRERTSMREFAMCDTCAHEYTDSQSRRYDAQPVCCHDCGPELYLVTDFARARQQLGLDGPAGAEVADVAAISTGTTVTAAAAKTGTGSQRAAETNLRGPGVPTYASARGAEALTAARKLLKQGGIVAIKGIGGFHLCCDATNWAAVTRLRMLKHRPVKPFAVMARDMDTVERECEVPAAARALLTGHQKPICLLPRRGFYGKAGDSTYTRPRLVDVVAPGNPKVGIMLPYAPVHYLLFDYPDDVRVPDLLVMTSGNPSGAPICRTDADALAALGGMCDALLSHNRNIRLRADDTVTDFFEGRPYMIRRSRGWAPLPCMVGGDSRGTALAMGGELKNTFCVARGSLFYPSPYIGDVSDLRTVRALRESITRLTGLLEAKPQVVACDTHPRYNSVALAQELAAQQGLPLVQVQHHYAHIVSCMAENDYAQPVIGLSFDGTGYGTDGTVWGGEVLRADYHGFTRLGSVAPFAQSGGDLASRDGWRVAVNLLYALAQAGRLTPRDDETATAATAAPLATQVGNTAIRGANNIVRDRSKTNTSTPGLPDTVAQTLKIAQRLELADTPLLKAQLFLASRKLNTVTSTSAGRLFDAVSALLGVRLASTFEGEASMYLQFAAEAWMHGGSAFTVATPPTGCAPAMRSAGQSVRLANGNSALPQDETAFFTDTTATLHAAVTRLSTLAGLAAPSLETLKQHADGRLLLPTDALFEALLRARLTGANPQELAYLFHAVLARQCVASAQAAAEQTGLQVVALSGGVFQNTLLLRLLVPALRASGLHVLLHSQIPPNDGGIALGQAVHAMATRHN